MRDSQQVVVLHRNYSLNGSDSSDNYESVFSYPMYRAIRDIRQRAVFQQQQRRQYHRGGLSAQEG